MAKFSQKIVLFIDPAAYEWTTPSKIANLFINRIAIDEDANHEILKIYQLVRFEVNFKFDCVILPDTVKDWIL